MERRHLKDMSDVLAPQMRVVSRGLERADVEAVAYAGRRIILEQLI